MSLLPVYVGLPVLAVVLLAFAALRAWRTLRGTRAALRELSDRLAGLSRETATLSDRLDTAEALSRVADR